MVSLSLRQIARVSPGTRGPAGQRRHSRRGIIGSAPPGARGQHALSPIDIEGRPIPSGQLTLPNGRPASGIMRVLFITGNRAGFYRPTFELVGGTSVQMTIVAISERAKRAATIK